MGVMDFRVPLFLKSLYNLQLKNMEIIALISISCIRGATFIIVLKFRKN